MIITGFETPTEDNSYEGFNNTPVLSILAACKSKKNMLGFAPSEPSWV